VRDEFPQSFIADDRFRYVRVVVLLSSLSENHFYAVAFKARGESSGLSRTFAIGGGPKDTTGQIAKVAIVRRSSVNRFVGLTL
jgi:hypothetical protein